MATCEDLNVALNANLQASFEGVVSSIKKYVDGKDSVLKSEITEQIVKELSEIDGLGAQLEKIQTMADTFAKVFDENEDGSITPEEILAKAVLLQQAIDGVNGRVDALTANVADVKSAIEAEIADLKSRVSALETSTATNRDELAKLKADVELNYVTKDCLETVVSVNTKGIVDAVNGILFPESEETSDGAVE